MNAMVRIVLACTVLLSNTAVKAQEFSEASYVGGLEGAAKACAEMFPAKAAIYKETLYRTVKCHLGPAEAAQWQQRLQTVHAAHYKDAYLVGKAEVANAPANIRKEQCGSIERMVCHANSPPDFPARK